MDPRLEQLVHMSARLVENARDSTILTPGKNGLRVIWWILLTVFPYS
jgi:hypothetical protein